MSRLITLLFVLAAVVLVLALLYAPSLAACLSGQGGPKSLAEWADAFTPVETLFSGLAFLGVLAALIMQHKELALQRSDLADTRAVQAAQQRALEEQAQAATKQAFERTFFSLAQSLEEIRESLAWAGSNGRPVFDQAFTHILNRGGLVEKTSKADFLDLYRTYLRDFSEVLFHYWNSLAATTRFVVENGHGPDSIYADVLRAQMTRREGPLLLYAVLTGLTSTDFEKNAKALRLFQSLDPKAIVSPEHVLWIP